MALYFEPRSKIKTDARRGISRYDLVVTLLYVLVHARPASLSRI